MFFYFLQLLDKTRYSKTIYVKGHCASRMHTNSKHFKSKKAMGNTSSDIYEVVMAYKRICLNMPIHIGINILLLSK